MEKREILLRLIDYYAGGNKSKFANQIGVSPQSINTWITRNTFDIDKIFAKCEGVSGDWLLTGKGKMLKTTQERTQAAKEVLRQVAKDDKERRLIPFYEDIATMGGDYEKRADVDRTVAVTEWVDAGDWFREATAAIRHYGDSMIEFPSGSILAVKRVYDRRLLINGENYVIETSEYRITKRIIINEGDDYLTAYSSNTEKFHDGTPVYPPMHIPLDAIRNIDLVLGCVQKFYSTSAIPIIRTEETAE